MTLIATIVAITLLAVGIGYAYTTSTQNSGNDVGSEYLTLVQGGEGAYWFSNGVEVEWNTVDRKVGDVIATEFTMQGMIPGDEADHMEGFNIKQLGDPFTVLIEDNGTVSHPDLECKISRSSDWNADNVNTTFFLKVENNSVTWFKFEGPNWPTFKKYSPASGKWDGSSTFTVEYDDHSKYYDSTVTVYYAIIGSAVVVEHDPGETPSLPSLPELQSGRLLNYARLTFEVITSHTN